MAEITLREVEERQKSGGGRWRSSRDLAEGGVCVIPGEWLHLIPQSRFLVCRTLSCWYSDGCWSCWSQWNTVVPAAPVAPAAITVSPLCHCNCSTPQRMEQKLSMAVLAC